MYRYTLCMDIDKRKIRFCQNQDVIFFVKNILRKRITANFL